MELQKENRKLHRFRERHGADAEIPVMMSARISTFLSLWLSCLHVVVEGYDRSYLYPDSLLSDPGIDRILTKSRREKLKRYRNAILHPELYDHPHVKAIKNPADSALEWGAELMGEFHRLFADKLGMP